MYAIRSYYDPELSLHLSEGCGAWVDRDGRAHAAGEVETGGIRVGDDDVTRPRVPDDGGGHQADRTGSRDQHVLPEHVETQPRVDGVSQGVETGQDVEGNVV